MINFAKEVIEASHHQPIVVDFWAPWCGPCRVLGPVIEALAEEQGDRWSLVKLNTEEQPDIAMEYGIRSIPNVKLFVNGVIKSEFAGALPRHQIMEWLDQNIPSPEREAWSQIKENLPSLNAKEARSTLREFLTKFPDHREARVQLARHLTFTKPAEAVAMVADVKIGQEGYDIADAIHTYTELLSLDHLANNDELTSMLVEAQEALARGDFREGLSKLIEVVSKDKDLHDQLPRRATIAVFQLLGKDHPETREFRRQFDMALY